MDMACLLGMDWGWGKLSLVQGLQHSELLFFCCSRGVHSPAGLPTVTMRPLEWRKSGKRPLVSCSVPKKFTSMQVRNVATGDNSASATTSLTPALLTRPHKPEGMDQGRKL